MSYSLESRLSGFLSCTGQEDEEDPQVDVRADTLSARTMREGEVTFVPSIDELFIRH